MKLGNARQHYPCGHPSTPHSPAKSPARRALVKPALWMKPASAAHPFSDELRLPLGRWIIGCPLCVGADKAPCPPR
jgi:hypothetical protein